MIRPAESRDIAAVRIVMQSVPGSWQQSWGDNVIATALRAANGLAFVWEEEEQVIGFVCAHDLGFRGYVSELVVSPSARRRGIGRQLLREVEHRLAERGIEVVIADVWRQAEGFYRSLGWRPPDVVLLRRRLADEAG